MPGLFAGTSLERPVTCEVCERPLDECTCPRDAAGQVLRPGEQSAVVRLVKRRKGKVVTTVTGLDPVASDLTTLARTLRQTCGAGGTVSEDGVLEIQGDHCAKIGDVLRAAGYGVKVVA